MQLEGQMGAAPLFMTDYVGCEQVLRCVCLGNDTPANSAIHFLSGVIHVDSRIYDLKAAKPALSSLAKAIASLAF